MKESTRKIDNFFAKLFSLVGKLLKVAFWTVIIGINGILFWRMFTSGDPKLMETLMVNDRTAAAYAEAGDSLDVIWQNQDRLNEEGLFAQSNLRYLPAIDQLQITARYNNSTIRAMAEAYELSAVPEREAEIFDITLVKVIAPTAEEQAAADDAALSVDALGDAAVDVALPRKEVRYFAAACISDTKTVYNYRRLLFEDVDLSDASALYLEFYYKEAIDYDAEPYSDVLIWLRGDDRAYELTRADRKALAGGAVEYD